MTVEVQCGVRLRLPLTASFDALLSMPEARDRFVGASGECGVRETDPLKEVGDAPFLLSSLFRLERDLFFCLEFALLACLSREGFIVTFSSSGKVDC